MSNRTKLGLFLVFVLAAFAFGAPGRFLLAQIAGGASGTIPISNGTILVSQTVSGDGTVSSGGVLAVTKVNGVPVGNTSWATTAARVPIFDGDSLESVAITGDVTVTSGGVTAIGAAKVTPAMLTATNGGLAVTLMAGFTPSGTGADAEEFVIPYYNQDGTTSVTYQLKRVTATFSTAGGAPAMQLEKSAATLTSVFGTATNMLSSTMTAGSGNSAITSTSIAASTAGQVSSGNRIRINVSTLGTATGWTVVAEFARIS